MTSICAISKILVFFVIICIARAAAGSCLSYGHSCWGGHGKRSASLRYPYVSPVPEKRTEDWYLSRLLKPSGEKSIESTAPYRPRFQDPIYYEKYSQIQFPKEAFTQLTNRIGVRTRGSADVGEGAGDEGTLNNNEAESEQFILPIADDLVWNPKLHLYQIAGEDDNGERSG